MYRAAFTVDNPTHTVALALTWWGREEYFVDGVLVQRQWSLRSGNRRTFRAGPHEICIQFSGNAKDFVGRAFVNGALHVDELYPDLKARFLEKQTPGYKWKIVAIWLGIGFVIGVLVPWW